MCSILFCLAMNAENSIEILNSDVVCELLRHLPWSAVVNFGATNTRFYRLALAYIDTHQQRHGTIKFQFHTNDQTTLRRLLVLFESRFSHLYIVIKGFRLDRDIFIGQHGSLIPDIQNLYLIMQDENHNAARSDEVLHDVTQSTENVIFTLNLLRMPLLRNFYLVFKIDIAVEYDFPYEMYMYLQERFDGTRPHTFRTPEPWKYVH